MLPITLSCEVGQMKESARLGEQAAWGPARSSGEKQSLSQWGLLPTSSRPFTWPTLRYSESRNGLCSLTRLLAQPQLLDTAPNPIQPPTTHWWPKSRIPSPNKNLAAHCGYLGHLGQSTDACRPSCFPGRAPPPQACIKVVYSDRVSVLEMPLNPQGSRAGPKSFLVMSIHCPPIS